ncbi:unnamed protein product [Closterium sp. Naga37s-1]|nr:unnamed protein product [Closterium sp. Naga37s-1]
MSVDLAVMMPIRMPSPPLPFSLAFHSPLSFPPAHSCLLVDLALIMPIRLVVAPILAGLLVDLAVIMPIRVPINESPLLSLYHDWALGLILLKLWARVVSLSLSLSLLMPICSPFLSSVEKVGSGHRTEPLPSQPRVARLVPPLAPSYSSPPSPSPPLAPQVTAQNHLLANQEWRARFLRLQQDGLRRLDARRTFQEIIAPVLLFLLTALTAPFLAVRAALPLLRLPPVLESAAFRFAWITALGVVGTARVWRRVCEWFASLHDAIRDDRYLVGRRLHNFQHQRR